MPLASPSACVVIKGVPQGTTAGDLERILQDYGEVRVRMGRHDRLEGARGIGPCFVEFASVDLAQAFVEGSIADFEVRSPPRARSAPRGSQRHVSECLLGTGLRRLRARPGRFA